MKYIKTYETYNPTNEGILSKMAIGAAILSALTSCRKDDDYIPSKQNQTPQHITTSVKNNNRYSPTDESVNGTWYPFDDCRKKQWEHFEVSDTILKWYFKGFRQDTITHGRVVTVTDTVPQIFYSMGYIKTEKQLNDPNIQNFFKLKNHKVYFYTRTIGTLDYTPMKGSYDSDLIFDFYVNEDGRLIFAGWDFYKI